MISIRTNLDNLLPIMKIYRSLFSHECSEWQIIILLMQNGFNPEQTANDIRAKSFLKSRGTPLSTQTHSETLQALSSSEIIKFAPAPTSRKPRAHSKQCPSTTSATIPSTLLLPISSKAGMPIPMASPTPSMPEWDPASLSTL